MSFFTRDNASSGCAPGRGRQADHRRRRRHRHLRKCAEAGGIDLIIIYNSGRFRMAGRGSLSGMMPYGDANAIVMDMAREVLPVVKKTPVLAGVCGTDPFRIMKLFLRDVQAAGFSGVQNFPTVGPDRRHVPPEPRRDRHGLRPGSGHDPPGPRTRPADVPVRLQRGGGRGDGQGRRRRADPAHGPDDQGHASAPRRR